MERTKIGLLLAKTEVTYGDDAVPAPGSNVIAAVRGEVTLDISAELLERNLLDGGYHRQYGPNVLPEIGLKFKTELRGNRTDGAAADISAGAIGQAVEADPLLRACDLAATYTAESSGGARDGAVIYKPAIPVDQGTGVTFYLYTEGKRYKLTGAKGDFGLQMTSGKFGYFDWNFRGLFHAPIDSAIPGGAAWIPTKPPIFERSGGNLSTQYLGAAVTLQNAAETITKNAHGLFNGDLFRLEGTLPAELSNAIWYFIRERAANTWKAALTRGGAVVPFTTDGAGVTVYGQPSLIYDGWAPTSTAPGPVFNLLNLKLGNAIAKRPDANANDGVRGFVITDRQSGGDINPESVKEATHPVWTDWKNGRLKKLYVGIGSQTGNRIVIGAKTVGQKINYEDQEGKRIQNASFLTSIENPGDAYGEDFYIEFK